MPNHTGLSRDLRNLLRALGLFRVSRGSRASRVEGFRLQGIKALGLGLRVEGFRVQGIKALGFGVLLPPGIGPA